MLSQYDLDYTASEACYLFTPTGAFRMSSLSRRRFVTAFAATTLASTLVGGFSGMPGVHAQESPTDLSSEPAMPQFTYDEVVRRARDLAAVAHDSQVPALPDEIANLDFDSWRDIRFKPDKALLASPEGRFRMQMFHPGFLFKRPVTVNIIRDGVATPVPYSAQSFDMGRNKFEKPLPVNLGFAGFRLHYPLNTPNVSDELVSFIGGSYFRFLSRGQQYGLSARGLAIDSGGTEEFPFFREFWVETPKPGDERATVYALLDSESITGAYQFFIYPGRESTMDVTATLFPRREIAKLGIAPLTSMFFIGENDRRFLDEYRPELHDSDGLLLHSASGEWIWRPLRNPAQQAVSSFMDNNIRGFGLLQRDRSFGHYQDIDLHYEGRPGYWVQPVGDWGPGRVELLELPTGDETNDNIVASWISDSKPQPGQTLVYRYRIRSVGDAAELHPGGRAINTFQGKPKAAGSTEPLQPGTRRFLIDFAGDDLAYYSKDPASITIDASISEGRILRTFLSPNPRIGGFRAGIDIEVPQGRSADVRTFLRKGDQALTETWIHPWASP